MRTMRDSFKQGGFTLIELLVVVAIIAVLAAILFPVFASAREKARQTMCASNERQLGLAIQQYTQDFDDTLPSGYANSSGALGFGWAGQIYPYVKSTGAYTCPDDKTKAVPPQIPLSYAYNENLAGDIMNARNRRNPNDHPTVTLAKATSPTVTVLLFEWQGMTSDLTAQPPEATANFGYGFEDTTKMVDGVLGGQGLPLFGERPPRHNPGTIFLALDGHVKWLIPIRVSSGVDQTTFQGNSSCTQNFSGPACSLPRNPVAAGTGGGLGNRFTLTFDYT